MELNVDEALRYLGIGGQAAESIRASVAAVADKLTAAIQPRYTYRVCSLQKTEAGFLLPEAELVLPGADAAKMLEQCDQAVLMDDPAGNVLFDVECPGAQWVWANTTDSFYWKNAAGERFLRDCLTGEDRPVICPGQSFWLPAAAPGWRPGATRWSRNWRIVFRTATERTGSVPGTEICRCLCSRRSAPHWIPKGGLDCM